MVKVLAVESPLHSWLPLAKCGVTVMLATIGAPVVFSAVKDGMVAVVPLAARPMAVLSLVHV